MDSAGHRRVRSMLICEGSPSRGLSSGLTSVAVVTVILTGRHTRWSTPPALLVSADGLTGVRRQMHDLDQRTAIRRPSGIGHATVRG